MTLEDEPSNWKAHPYWKVSNMLLGKSRGQLLTAPERMKQLGQSGNDTQLWMCLLVKVKSNAVKNDIASDQIRSDQSLSRVQLFATP